MKGVAQMAAGAALAVVGVPLCVLPGSVVAAIVEGVALANRGQRNYSGRAAAKIEHKIDAAASKAAAVAKREAVHVVCSAGNVAACGIRSAWAKRSAKR